MSLYMIIEIKDPEENNQILHKYTVEERIYEEVCDFRDQPNRQRGIIMTIDLEKMNEYYKSKRLMQAQLKA